MTAEHRKPSKSGRVLRKANLLVLAAMTVVAGTFGRLPAVGADAFSAPGAGVTRHRPQESEEVLQLVIGDGGFEPAQVTRRAGKFLLTADDRRGDKSQALKLKLSRDGGEQLRDIEVPTGVVDWAEELDLPEGRYVLTEVSHPEWSCRIVLE